MYRVVKRDSKPSCKSISHTPGRLFYKLTPRDLVILTAKSKERNYVVRMIKGLVGHVIEQYKRLLNAKERYNLGSHLMEMWLNPILLHSDQLTREKAVPVQTIRCDCRCIHL